MKRPAAPALDDSRIERWTAAAVPWWVTRVVLIVAWFIAFLLAVFNDSTTCTPADPSVCGPDVSFAVAIVVLLATPILLWWMPLAGCAAGVLFAVLDLVFDDQRAANIAFAFHGLLCVAVAILLVEARGRQTTIVAEVAEPVHLDPAVAARVRDSFPRWGGRSIIAVLLLVAGVGGFGWYDHRAGQVARHEAAAVHVDGVVRSADNAAGEIVVDVPQPVRVNGLLNSYEPGQVVPVLVDGSWVKLVAEPEDVTPWLSGGLGAIALALLLLIREQRMRAARRRLLNGPLPAVELTAEPDDDGRAVLHGGMAVVPVEASPLELEKPLLTGEDVPWDDKWTAEEVEDFGQDWRGPGRRDEPQTVTVAGDLRDGGWVLLISDSHVLVPEAPLRMPRKRPEITDPLPGDPLPAAELAGDLPELPVEVGRTRRDRVFGALSMLGFAAPVAVAAGLPEGWWQTIIFLFGGGSFVYSGWARLSDRLTLTRGGLVLHDGLRVHHVPWPRLHGVRVDGGKVWLAWEPNIAAETNGVSEEWGAVMLRLRDLAQAAGDPGGQATSRLLGGGLAVVLVYVLAAIVSVLV
ncbi:PH domain-containing protein [Actinoplanes bogorensis]|uniref:PH domain-containing protein n=1 Tax=Paractinoplanes bogorensis TaxID=1610840 RepID=A0ABS5Z233_9ACTN|nr:PH domain-containing protein [Actinoplanes bogorensis]MBU2669764.1 PH domain-containing protein [Actinoplanes bogorensis]